MVEQQSGTVPSPGIPHHRAVATGVVVAILVALAAATAIWVVSRPDGLTRDQAIEMAERRVIGAPSATFVSASSSRLGDFDPAIVQDRDRLVWQITFEGEFEHPSCGPLQADPETCRDHTSPIMRVYLDEQTGEFVMSYIGD